MDQFADVLHRRIRQKFVPGAVIVFAEDFPQDFFHLAEIEDHPAAVFPGDRQLHFVGVSMQAAALRMIRQIVSTIDVFRDPQSHIGNYTVPGEASPDS